MYQFSAIVTNDYTIEVTSNTYWSCKAEGNFKLSQYDGSGDTKINIEIPDDVMLAEGTVYFSYGDERCKYPKFEVSLANLCYITSYPNYNTCDDNGTKKKTVYFFYDEPLETFNLSVFCYDGWTVDSSASDFNYITSNNEVMIIASGNDGELRIIPNHQCDGKNIIYAKLMKIPEIEVAVKSVSINKDSITLIINETQTLTATVYPYNATNKQVRWSTSDSNIATVGQNGIVTAKAIGNCTITVTTEDGGYTDECSVKVISTPTGDYVEIGGIKWATKNVGAESITSMGLYFQWGDTQGYTAAQVGTDKQFNWDDYKYTNDGGETFTKYDGEDGLTTLQPSDDAATAALGGDWRMPTKEEFEALSAAVNTEWVTNYQGSGVNGGLMTDKTDSSKVLFFPACGYAIGGSIHYGYSSYWNSSLVNAYVNRAHNLRFNSDNFFWNYYNFRYQGLQIRGIFTGNTIDVEDITLSKESIELKLGDSEHDHEQLTFYVTPEGASREVRWVSSNENVATVSQNGLVTAKEVGNCEITVTAVHGNKSDTCYVTVTSTPTPPGPTEDYVEIGGIKWATKNIGAENITDVGLYFQWGDTQGYTASEVGSGEGQKYFGWVDYKYCSNAGTSSSAITKYNDTDGKTVLLAEDDAATFMLGNEWRMPTSEEYEALKSVTTTAWTTSYQGSGVEGIIYTDKTDSSKTLFFPASGEAHDGTVTLKGTTGYNWTCSLFINTISRAEANHFNSLILDILVPERCVGCTIRPIKSSEGPVPPPAEFTLSPVLMSTSMGQNLVTEFSNEYIGATGNALFLCKVDGANVEDVVVTSSSHFLFNKISDWGFLMIKNGMWGYWPGGTGGSTWQEDIVFSYDGKSYTAKFKGELDEDNTEFLMGACTNKVFRIPGNGVTSFTTYCLYPYTFDSNYFGMTGFDLMYYDIENMQAKAISSDNLSDTIFTSLSQQVDGLNVKLSYSVGANTTGKYRLGAIYTDETLIHFIQDPVSTSMIYFGSAPYERYITDDRVIYDDSEYLFHQLGSYNLSDSYDISSSYGYTLLYPINLSDTYDITYEGGTPTEWAETYTWGGLVYKRLDCSSSITVKFRKK